MKPVTRRSLTRLEHAALANATRKALLDLVIEVHGVFDPVMIESLFQRVRFNHDVDDDMREGAKVVMLHWEQQFRKWIREVVK